MQIHRKTYTVVNGIDRQGQGAGNYKVVAKGDQYGLEVRLDFWPGLDGHVHFILLAKANWCLKSQSQKRVRSVGILTRVVR